MSITLRNVLLTNSTHKISSLLIAFCMWNIMNESQPISQSVQIPVCFYNTNPTHMIKAPESIAITLHGTRSQLRACMHDNLAIHLDAQTLIPGNNTVTLAASHLLLPPAIKLATTQKLNILVELK